MPCNYFTNNRKTVYNDAKGIDKLLKICNKWPDVLLWCRFLAENETSVEDLNYIWK